MSFIDVDKITYCYPVPEDFEEAPEKKGGKKPPVPAALDQVNLQVERGQFICILGRNGSGKSTLARHLNALLVPEEGTVWINGLDTKDEKNVWDIRALAGMVFQNPDNQIIGSVVEEDVAFGLENLGVPSEEIRARVASVLEEVGMSAHAKRSPNDLSGGQKQRVAVAGILAMEPACIILDEATAMLDPKGREEIMKMALKLNREKKITVIAITHFMDEALSADRVFVMEKGKIVMQGTPKEVFSQKEKIEAYGLRLPQICRLANLLREAGMELPQGILSRKELKEAVLQYENTV